MVKAYHEADRIRQERNNMAAWLQGMYVYDAIGKMAPILHAFAQKGTKAEPYPKEPYPIYGQKEQSEEEKEEQERQEALRAQLYMNNMVRAGKNWGKH